MEVGGPPGAPPAKTPAVAGPAVAPFFTVKGVAGLAVQLVPSKDSELFTALGLGFAPPTTSPAVEVPNPDK